MVRRGRHFVGRQDEIAQGRKSGGFGSEGVEVAGGEGWASVVDDWGLKCEEQVNKCENVKKGEKVKR